MKVIAGCLQVSQFARVVVDEGQFHELHFGPNRIEVLKEVMKELLGLEVIDAGSVQTNVLPEGKVEITWRAY